MTVRLTRGHGGFVPEITQDAADRLPVRVSQLMLYLSLQHYWEADQSCKSFQEQPLTVELREEGLLAVGVDDRASFHHLGPTHRSQENPLTLLHALYEELSHPVGFPALPCDSFVVQLSQSQKAKVLQSKTKKRIIRVQLPSELGGNESGAN